MNGGSIADCRANSGRVVEIVRFACAFVQTVTATPPPFLSKKRGCSYMNKCNNGLCFRFWKIQSRKAGLRHMNKCNKGLLMRQCFRC